MHEGSMQSCLAMHSCPQWETIIGSLSHISKAWVWVGTCPSGCLPCVYHKLPPFYCVSIGRTAVHRGSMYTCLRMHGCPPWETTHWEIVNLSIACRWVGSMPLGLFTMCLSWISARSICFERGGGQRHMGVPCTGVRPCMAVPPQETTHWNSVAPSKWISMHRLCAPRVVYLMGGIS